MNTPLDFRQIEVFRPYEDEFPHELLELQDCGEVTVDRWVSAETVRIAKADDAILGIYAMQRLTTERFLLHGIITALAIRKRGLGRWLTGHAIGVAESKGGRHVLLPATGGSRCFVKMGFVRDPDGWRFDLIPE